MDGILYDSMPKHALAWGMMCDREGIKYEPNEFFAYEGRTGASTIGYRNQAKERVDDYIPGMPVRMEFQLWPIMWALQKGSKIRVSVSSSNFPEFHVHTNMQGSWSMQDKIKTVVNKVNVENSFLELPLSDRKNEE